MKPSRRLEAVVQGRQGREVGPEEAHARNVLAITRRIHTKEREHRQLLRAIVQVRRELKAARRELRAVLQRDSNMMTEVEQLLAGQADATDRAIALAEQQRSGRCDFEYSPDRRCALPAGHAGAHRFLDECFIAPGGDQ